MTGDASGLNRSQWIENAVFARRMHLLLKAGVNVSDSLLASLTLCREPVVKKALFDTFTAWSQDPRNNLGRDWQDRALSRSLLLLAHSGVEHGELSRNLGKASDHLFDLLSHPAGTEKKWEQYREQYFFFSQLFLLLSGGVSLVNALFAVGRETPGEIFRRIAGQLEHGGEFAHVLDAHAKYLDAAYVTRVCDAEAAGGLEDCLAVLRQELADRLGYGPLKAVSRAGQSQLPEKARRLVLAKVRVAQGVAGAMAAQGEMLPVESFRQLAGEFQSLGIRDIAERVEEVGLKGLSWIEALKAHPEIFPKWELALLSQAEEKAELPAALATLAEFVSLEL